MKPKGWDGPANKDFYYKLKLLESQMGTVKNIFKKHKILIKAVKNYSYLPQSVQSNQLLNSCFSLSQIWVTLWREHKVHQFPS